jgi:uncharacterized membrane protein YqjE
VTDSVGLRPDEVSRPSIGAPATGTERSPAEAPTPGILDELSRALHSARSALSAFLELVALEARGAGVALVWMLAGSLLSVVFFVAAWLALMAGLAIWVVSLGMPPIAAAIAIAAINMLAGALLIHRCIGLSRAPLFSATRRQVAGQFAVAPPLP